MDFVLGLRKTRSRNDTLWVIVVRLTKSVKFIPINNQWDMGQLAQAYLKNVVRYHGVPRSIVSDHDTIDTCQNFGNHFRKLWAQNFLEAHIFTPLLMGKLNARIRHLKICCQR